LKKRCFYYCNGCGKDSSPWKIVEADSKEAENFHLRTRGCIEPQHHECCEEKKHKCHRRRRHHEDSESESERESESESEEETPEVPIPQAAESGHRRKHHDSCGKRRRHYDPRKCKNPLAATLISVRDPDAILFIPIIEPLANNVSVKLVGNHVNFLNWKDLVPDVLDSFDNINGIYTVPSTGDYQIELVVNFRTSVSFPVNIDYSNLPFVQIYDVDTDNGVQAASLPVDHTVILIPPLDSEEPPIEITITTILGIGQVIINGVYSLIEGQRLRVRAVSNGLTFTPIEPLSIAQLPGEPFINFSPDGYDTTLAIYKLRNTPIVTIHCNN